MKLYSLLDLETTGFADSGAVIPQQIIEAAAIVVDETGAIQRVYYGRFTPTIPVLPGAARVNGYTAEAWAGCPELAAHDLNTLAAFMDGTQVGQVRFMLIGLGLVLLAAFRPQGVLGSKEEMALDDR